MGKKSKGLRASTGEKYAVIKELLHGYTYSRTIMPARVTSHGGGITSIFKHAASGAEKPIPFERLKEMESTVKKALRDANLLKKRDKNAIDCDDPLLSKIMTAKQAAVAKRQTFRKLTAA